jgi:hypothetical protein
VAAPRRGRAGTSLGTSSNTDGFVNFPLTSIRQVVKFDLENATFTIGDKILRQTVGIPMGSPISPVLAILVCAYSEHLSLCDRQKHQRRKVHGVRYVDDGFYMTGFHSSDPNDRMRAQLAIDAVTERGVCYHKNLSMEMDPNQDHIDMLESTIDLSTPGVLTATFWHKNADSLRTTGKQKFLKFQQFSSYSPYSAKRGVIISTLMRMRAASSSVQGVIDTLPLWCQELRSLGYPKSIVVSAINRLHSRALHMPTRDTYWEGVTAAACDAW